MRNRPGLQLILAFAFVAAFVLGAQALQLPGPQGGGGVTVSTGLSDSANLARLNAANVFTNASGQKIEATEPSSTQGLLLDLHGTVDTAFSTQMKFRTNALIGMIFQQDTTGACAIACNDGASTFDLYMQGAGVNVLHFAANGNATFSGTLATNTGLLVKEIAGAPRMGTLTLNGSTEVTVTTTAVTATSRIFLTIQAPGGTPAGIAYVSSRVASTSFGVKGIVADTSTVAWLIVEPAP